MKLCGYVYGNCQGNCCGTKFARKALKHHVISSRCNITKNRRRQRRSIENQFLILNSKIVPKQLCALARLDSNLCTFQFRGVIRNFNLRVLVYPTLPNPQFSIEDLSPFLILSKIDGRNSIRSNNSSVVSKCNFFVVSNKALEA